MSITIPDGHPDLNLAAWLARRREQIGPWSDYIIREVGKLEHEIANLRYAAPGWQPIETAPKDGTRVMLWRGHVSFGRWAEMVIAEWHDDAWVWPDGNPSTHGEWSEDDLEDGYFSAESFTHWMPLPAPPSEDKP